MTAQRENEHEMIAKRAAKEALVEFFVTLGVDISKPADVLEMQRDFQHLRDWRVSVETVKSKGLIAALGFLGAGALAMLYSGFMQKVTGH